MRQTSGMRRLGRAVLGGLVAMLLVRSAAPCPFCGIVELTLRERIETPHHSLLVEWVSGEEGNIDTEVLQSTTFRVLKVWRGDLVPGQLLPLEHYYEGRAGERSLLIGNRPEGAGTEETEAQQPQGAIRWDRAIPLSPEALAYVESLPSSEAPVGERLRHAMSHLESADPTIANDAFSVVGSARYEEIAAAREFLDADKVRRWVHDPDTLVMRLGVYGMLLGLAGSEQDIAPLHKRIFVTDTAREIRVGIDGVMGGYLLLAATPGLEELERAYLADPHASQDNVIAVTSALRFMWEYGDGKIPADRLQQSMRLALQHEETLEIAIVDLARWQDWGVTPQIVALYPDAYRGLQRRIVGFLSMAAEVAEQDLSDEERAGIKLARQTLEAIQQDDPELYRSARRGIIPR
jgi:hypothetical protein